MVHNRFSKLIKFSNYISNIILLFSLAQGTSDRPWSISPSVVRQSIRGPSGNRLDFFG